MLPFFLLLLLLLFFPAHCSIQCLVSGAAEFGKPNKPVAAQCFQNWCKKVTGGTGLVEYNCDETGDCSRNANNDPYDPYVIRIENSWSQNGRTIKCCNWDYCNSSSFSSLLVSFLVFNIFSLF